MIIASVYTHIICIYIYICICKCICIIYVHVRMCRCIYTHTCIVCVYIYTYIKCVHVDQYRAGAVRDDLSLAIMVGLAEFEVQACALGYYPRPLGGSKK